LIVNEDLAGYEKFYSPPIPGFVLPISVPGDCDTIASDSPLLRGVRGV